MGSVRKTHDRPRNAFRRCVSEDLSKTHGTKNKILNPNLGSIGRPLGSLESLGSSLSRSIEKIGEKFVKKRYALGRRSLSMRGSSNLLLELSEVCFHLGSSGQLLRRVFMFRVSNQTEPCYVIRQK